jgi:phospholipase/carboxylesterase
MFLMVPHRLVALVAAAMSIMLMIGGSPAHARDSSGCSRNDPPPIEASETAAPCAEASGKAAATSPIASPVTRADRFVYRLLRPQTPSGETIVLLHGSGGDEVSMLKLAQRVAPDATLLGVRGRVVQKGIKRWYARLSPTEFDQADIRSEARAFVDFLERKMTAEKLDRERAIFIGYSNGANLIAAVTLLYPDLVQRAVLLRAMPVLDSAPAADLKRSRFLTIAGQGDEVYAPFASALEDLLRDRGALVDSRRIAAGHLLAEEDVKLVRDWLKASNAIASGTPR